MATSSSPGKIELWKIVIDVGNIFPILLFIFGFVPLAAGVGGIAAIYHQPFARWAGDLIPKLISEQDPKVSVDLNDEPLDSVTSRLHRPALYVVRTSPAAGKTTLNGRYRDVPCGAELMIQICRNETARLSCDIDADARVIRICAKADDAPCKQKTL